MRLALYQPEIAPNVGTLLRLGACLGVAIDIIEPCGFPFDLRLIRRSAMDYLDRVELTRHRSWAAFLAARAPGRLVLLTTRAELSHVAFTYRASDIRLAGRESAGAPPAVHEAADARLRIPMRPGLRSLNLAVACALVLGEALRQTGGFTEERGREE